MISSNINEVQGDSVTVVIPGEYLAAWKVAYADFVKIDDMTEEQKKLQHYKIEFYEEGNQVVVHFIAKLLSEKEAAIFNRMVLGRGMEYRIDKGTLKIIKRIFYKA